MSKKMTAFFILAAFLLCAAPAFAHTPLCDCWNESDGTVTCEGGFSDGSSAAGVAMSVVDASGKVIESGKLNELSEFSFKRPEGDFTVRFEGGEGHSLEIPGSKIH